MSSHILSFQIYRLIVSTLLVIASQFIVLPAFLQVPARFGIIGCVLWMIVDTRYQGYQVCVVDMRTGHTTYYILQLNISFIPNFALWYDMN